MNLIMNMKYFNIYSDGHNHFIVHNTRKKFSEGHTHIDNFNSAKYISYLALYKKIPQKRRLSLYLIESVIRLSTDKEYIESMYELKRETISKKEARRS